MNDDVPDSPLDPLTGREYEILQLLADGLSDQEVAERLFLSTGTIKWHLKNIYSKLGTHKRTAAIARARAFGLLYTDTEQQAPHPIKDKHNLPYQTSAFIGRETDTANILSMLADPSCRLITLVGMGGIGKTRLAVQCAGQLVDTFADGVWFVSLDSVTASFLPSAIADALHLHLFGHDDLRTQLLSLLRHRRQFLIFDSFEHLVDEAAYIAQILAAAPEIKILVTSREV
jgi:ATP/maltotriose-dependent transcriptional regulator MalT